MLLKIPDANAENENQVTDEAVYWQRRQVLKSLGFLGAAALMTSPGAQAVFF
ncbi:MAG: sulfoxide reductase catalytic subunit YedY [Paraglaciecola sp.]|jgi:sulfoxide reductase catalytic subunit YedY